MNLRRNFERFCYRNRNKGIPNLMLYIVLGTALVYFVSMITGSTALYYFLAFDRNLILRCVRFSLPEGLDETGGTDSICNSRKFRARVIANYVDTDFVCCDTKTEIL